MNKQMNLIMEYVDSKKTLDDFLRAKNLLPGDLLTVVNKLMKVDYKEVGFGSLPVESIDIYMNTLESIKPCLNIMILMDYIDSNLTLNEYLKSVGLGLKKFTDAINEMKNYDYVDKGLGNLSLVYCGAYVDMLRKLTCIINALVNGVLVNGKTRKFDIIDYYEICSVMPEAFFYFAKSCCSANVLTLLANVFTTESLVFFPQAMTRVGVADDTAKIRETNYTFNNVTISDEEKEMIIRYLIFIQAPVTNKTFKTAAKRYLSNDLYIYGVCDNKPYKK